MEEIRVYINKYSKKWYVWAILIFIIVITIPSSPKEDNIAKSTESTQQEFSTSTKNSLVENIESSSVETDVLVIQNNNEHEQSTNQYTYYSVVKVIDGDTVKVNINGTVETLRLIGIDTPETVDPRKPVQCFGVEASNKAKALLTGKRVRLEYDQSQGERDKYQRLLAYVYIENGVFFNKYMIEQGYAHEYTYNTPYKYQAEFKQAETNARNSNLGLWSPDTCNGGTASDPQEEPQTSVDRGYYTSSHYTAKYYYPAECEAWQGLSERYLKHFDSLDDLLNQYSRTLSPQC